MTLGSLISRGDGAGQYEGIGIHCVLRLIIYTLLQGRWLDLVERGVTAAE